MQYTPNDFFAKWYDRFRPGNVLVEKVDFQEFVLDIKDTFGVTVASVPPYIAGTNYAKDFLVRYTQPGAQEAFYYSLNAGVLTAPGTTNTTDWKVVPGPVLPTELSQELTLLQAQGIDQTSVKAGRLYLIDLGPDANGNPRTMNVHGVSNDNFDIEGTLEVNGVRTAITDFNVQAVTWKVAGVDAYTKSQTDVLLATKQGAVLQQVYQGWPFNATTLTLTSSAYNKYLRLDAQANSTVNLPTPTAADVGKIIVLWHYGRSANLVVAVQASYTNGVKPLDTSPTAVVPVLPFNYVAQLAVVLVTRGTPYSDVVPAYALVALSPLDTQALVTPAQLATVATTLPLTATRTAAYTLTLADAGCVVPVSSSSDIIVTVPDVSAVPFSGPVIIYVRRKGTGKVLLQPGSANVIIQSRDGLHVDEADEVSLHLEQPNLWYMKGGIS